MEIIVCSDVHNNFKAFDSINKKPIFLLGDIYTNQKLKGLFFKTLLKFYLNKVGEQQLIKKFQQNKEKIEKSKIGKEIPAFFKDSQLYMLPGNHEDKQFYQKIIRLPNIRDVHNKKMSIGNIEIIGHGGMFVPSQDIKAKNFFWFTDSEVANNLRNLDPDQNCIIMLHQLPLGPYRKETRKVIEEINPKFVIGCHNHKGKSKRINGINYINCGALKYNKFKTVNLK